MRRERDAEKPPKGHHKRHWHQFSGAYLWAFISVLVAVLYVSHISSAILDDDTAYLAYLGTPPTEPAQAIERALERRVATLPHCDLVEFRLTFRDRYGSNYAGYSALQSVTYSLGRSLGENHIASLVLSHFVNALIAGAAAIGLLLAVSARAGPRKLRLAIAGGILFCALADLLADSRLVPTFWIVNITSAGKTAAELIYSLFIVSPAHSPFGVTPRNFALALFAAGLVLRWRGKPTAAAAVILSIAALHQTYGGLALFLYIAATSVSDPEGLRPLRARLALTAAALLYVWREAHLTQLQVSPLLSGIGVVAVAASGFAVTSSELYQRTLPRAARRFTSQPVYIDAAIIILLCVLVAVVAYVFARSADPITQFYVWADLSTRIWSFARFPLFVAAAMIIIARSKVDQRHVGRAMSALAAFAIIPAAMNIDPGAFERLAREGSAQLGRPAGKTILFPSAEAWLYSKLAAVSAGEIDGPSFAQSVSHSSVRCVDWSERTQPKDAN